MYLKDIRNFVSKLSLRRITNAFQILLSYHVAKYAGKAVQWGLPFTVSFEPTTSCNLRCPECPSGLRAFTRPTGMLSNDFFRQTVAEIADRLIYLYFYFQGEPYLNPEFLDMVKYASDKGIYTVTSTNGHYLTEANARRTVESGLDRIIISIDGTTQETYQSYRIGGKLEKVLDGTRRLAADLGVDEVKLKTAQVYEYEHGNPLIPTIDKYSRYKQQTDGTYTVKNKLSNHCWKLWHSCVITWDGKVVPCCFDKDATHRLGDLQTQTFAQVWHSEAYYRFRRSILQSRKNIDICANCSEGTKVWA